jgi:3-deoxy-manno-octulosonate cytidylyltransferase (CMP-KDO synthetase)
MTAVGIVPARFAARRFPGKPLVPIAGVPMLVRVVQGARSAKRLRQVLVATDDERIAALCRAEGIPVTLTSREHATGTDRVAEAARSLADEIVVNIQGDEPLIEGHVIDTLVDALAKDAEAPMATLAHPAGPDARGDPNRVKVVVDRRGRALYFSRSPIPFASDPERPPRTLQHVGLYAYRRSFLSAFVTLPRTALEESEALEQLRALEHGHPVHVAEIAGWESVPVDVPADVARVERRLRELGRR